MHFTFPKFGFPKIGQMKYFGLNMDYFIFQQND
ncbi:hypothetical protein BN8_04205 [Fibrisoma limi BUZ 3]|uniref:Uncharacterized protein n=1 Tax=Fibrisoma limi BUZ 3 TaxID=1185876 RepID=I2GM51_9BACT|nr:hypothetical protein BN8_04205 [Fibrisoma limi BUZ 3]